MYDTWILVDKDDLANLCLNLFFMALKNETKLYGGGAVEGQLVVWEKETYREGMKGEFNFFII